MENEHGTIFHDYILPEFIFITRGKKILIFHNVLTMPPIYRPLTQNEI